MSKILVNEELLKEIKDQLVGTQQDKYVESTQMVLNNISAILQRQATKRVIVAGGRNLKDYKLIEHTLNELMENQPNQIEIVSGGQMSIDEFGNRFGADYLAEQWAEKNAIQIHKFPANWNKHNKAAGPIRNRQMAQYGDALIAFWDGITRGTQSMIEEARAAKLPVNVIRYVISQD